MHVESNTRYSNLQYTAIVQFLTKMTQLYHHYQGASPCRYRFHFVPLQIPLQRAPHNTMVNFDSDAGGCY